MLGKYKKMSLAAAACTLLGVSTSDAAVTLTFAQSGPNVTASWSGSYALPDNGGPVGAPIGSRLDAGTGYGSETGSASFAVGGMAVSLSLASFDGAYTGPSFGFVSNALIYPVGASGAFAPVGVMTFANKTLAGMGVSAFNNTLAFTGVGDFEGSRTISYTTIPEPSGVALVALGSMVFAFRRLGRRA